jgi:hypothetical protein
MNRCALLFVVAVVFAASACAKPLATAKVLPDVNYISREFAAEPNDVYYSVRWGLDQNGYAVAHEDLKSGIVTTTWQPVTSDSHYVPMFDRRDYIVTKSYHQLEIQISSQDGRSRVKVGSRIKSLVSNLKSSGIEERKVLASIGDHLGTGEPEITNLGVTR